MTYVLVIAILILFCWGLAGWSTVAKCNAEITALRATLYAIDISDELLEAVEGEVGMGWCAWDCIEPKQIIAASINCYMDQLV